MTPDNRSSVSRFLQEFKGGDSAAFNELWNRYFTRLVAVARRRLQSERRLAGADEEDIALSAFKSFHRRARRGDFPRLDDRDDLWVQLVTLARQKAVDFRRRERALKRGGDRRISEADLGSPRDGDDAMGLAAIVGQEPDPAFSAIMTDECRRLLDSLGDETLQQIALAKMGLYTNLEIAGRFQKSLSWVNRKLDLIRSIWEATQDRARAESAG
jgi:DNA-directed RNA polymerase specialized sigma24 family protein